MRRGWAIAAGVAVLGVLVLSAPAWAQQFSLNLGAGGGGGNANSTTLRIIQLIALTTVLSVAPSILVMVTSFTRIVIVLGFLRQALGTMQSPPNMVLVSLAMFLTAFIMAPTLEQSWNDGVQPYVEGSLEEAAAFEATVKPLQTFMLRHVRDQDLQLFLDLSRTPDVAKAEDAPLKALIPAFMISELRRAFEIGFLIFLPFIVIDMVIASVLMSMGMMMIPPAMVSLPFKLIFFVLVDGWYMVVGSLVQSFGGA
ncbi:flagellar type III secretion system pore protein FliP [Magnetospirillum gryphiswaldense]|uniref:Flagellar biosynthetic protein FliP n=1 Tax=Magnetospirillum gryphiswaldense TaxID=55518 RepID=A4U380_9PROT|nr:flagellar type III secretion system pore protein FliP [Magnetospirillum gryphiswaldense]AVM75857.1 Flagellar biosynthetic protein FliP precursor [Magnetospirillum gryphiswaldense MSR-1]AVM79760.1 Flagellar biosynthetic protein FliP precursor [Magnetospirillum gryphiswaldense]CAM77337.1 Type III secretion system inner membrane P protein [Magnetospirillum gryphiswaldense MSR-1]